MAAANNKTKYKYANSRPQVAARVSLKHKEGQAGILVTVEEALPLKFGPAF